MINELRSIKDFKDEPVNPGLNRYAILFIAFLLVSTVGVYGLSKVVDHQQSLASPSDPVITNQVGYEWPVPVGSPEIGVRPDGTVGSINEYGRISAV